MKKRFVVLISGSGSNLAAILAACQSGQINGEVVAVISNRPNVYGLERAEAANVPAITIDHKTYESREAFDAALDNEINKFDPDLVVCAGFMRILTEAFTQKWAGKLVNIHPSILPLFKGLNTHQRALDAGMAVHGCTIHWVNAGVDEGAIIAQAIVPILVGDDADKLAARVHKAEHKIYPMALAAIANGSITYGQNKTHLNGHPGALHIFEND